MEQELRNALRRKEPGGDFTERVMERVRGGQAPRLSPQARGQARAPVLHHWRAIAATVLLTITAAGWTAHAIAERRAGERAKEDVLLALRITGSKVHYAQSQIHEIGRR